VKSQWHDSRYSIFPSLIHRHTVSLAPKIHRPSSDVSLTDGTITSTDAYPQPIYYYSYPVRTLWAYAGSYCVVFAQGNPLGKKPAPLSRLNCAMPAQESVIPSKRRLSLILMSIVLVTVVLRGCVKPFEVCRTVAASQR